MRVGLTGLLMALAVVFVAPAQAAPTPLEYFSQLPATNGVALSPNGKYFATIQSINDQDFVAVFDTESRARISLFAADDPKRKSEVHPEKRTRIRSVRWFNDDRLSITADIVKLYRFGGRSYATSALDECSIIFVNRDGTQPVALACSYFGIMSYRGPDADTMVVYGYNFGKERAETGRVPGEAESVHVFTINIRTGDVKLIERGNSRTAYWIADRNGVPRVRVDQGEGKVNFFARAPGSTEWVPAGSAPIRPWDRNDDPSKDFAPAGFTENPNEIVLNYTLNGRGAIGVYDLTQKKMVRTLFSDPNFDYGGLISDRDGNVLGAGIQRWKYEQDYTDPTYRALQAEIRQTFPGQDVILAGVSTDRQRALVYVEGSMFPGGAFTFLDFQKGSGVTLVNLYPNLKDGMTGKTSVISYAARDGKQIDAYLTVPPGSTGRNMPGIVMPHGGPHARDVGGFDFWADFLANRGYSVLRPQFRGSRGFGVEHLEAGRYQWGLRMQDDVTDGVKHMIASGQWDPKRVCIFGWSYGGYAAMAGAVFTPELYRCVAAGAGVSDLVEILKEEQSYDSNNSSAQFWRKTIGSLGKDLAKIQAASPVRFVDKVIAPVLLIHGEWDLTVLPNQSEFFAKALEKAGKPFEHVVLKREDHYLFTQVGRTQMFKSLEAFLLKHNPPN